MRIFLALFVFLFSSYTYNIYSDIDQEMFFVKKDFRLYKNGECVQHNSQPQIQYAISGKEGSYYQLTVWQKNMPRSMIMGFPIHSAEQFIGKMFHKVDCNPDHKAYNVEIFDDFYDPYRDTSPQFIGYM